MPFFKDEDQNIKNSKFLLDSIYRNINSCWSDFNLLVDVIITLGKCILTDYFFEFIKFIYQKMLNINKIYWNYLI